MPWRKAEVGSRFTLVYKVQSIIIIIIITESVTRLWTKKRYSWDTVLTLDLYQILFGSIHCMKLHISLLFFGYLDRFLFDQNVMQTSKEEKIRKKFVFFL